MGTGGLRPRLGAFPGKRPAGRRHPFCRTAAVQASHSCFRQRVKHLQHRPLVLVTDGHPVIEGLPPGLRERLPGSRGRGWRRGCMCSFQAPRPRVQRVGALGKPRTLQHAGVVEKAPEGILRITERGGRLGLGLLGAIGFGARGLRKASAPVGGLCGGTVAAAREGAEERAVGALQQLQVEGGGGRLLPPRGGQGHGRRDVQRGRRGGHGRGGVWCLLPPARLPLGALPRLKRPRFGDRRDGGWRRGFKARLWGPDCKMDRLLPKLVFR